MGNRVSETGRRLLCLQTYLQISSNREIYLENCRRILEYNDIRIVVETTDLRLEIWGKNLQADSRSPESLQIHGEIQSMTFMPKGVQHGTTSTQ